MDIHLDTSWCPVCDRLILPKRRIVPVAPQQATLAINPSVAAGLAGPGATTSIKGTTRGKHGTIKGRVQHGGGLLQGTGRVRPGLARPQQQAKIKSPPRGQPEAVAAAKWSTTAHASEQTPAAAPVRTRTIIDQAQTPLYCSEECRKYDLEWSWPVAVPANTINDDRGVVNLKGKEVATPASRRAEHGDSQVSLLGAHPAQLNPAQASPPSLSPVLPPVPPNSWRVSNFGELRVTTARLVRSESEHSDSSSSATGASFASASAGEHSPVEVEKAETAAKNANRSLGLFNYPAPPPLAPLPNHPNSLAASAARKENTKSANEVVVNNLLQGGTRLVIERLQSLYRASSAEGSKEKLEREEKEKKEKALLDRWDVTGEMRKAGLANEKSKTRRDEPTNLDPTRWYELVYGVGNGMTGAPPGVISTHRRSTSDATQDDSLLTTRNPHVRSPGVPNRTQSALELYSKYPLFSRPSSKSIHTKSSASIAASYTPAYGLTTSASASSLSAASTNAVSDDADSCMSALTIPGVDPQLYAGKRRSKGRRAVAQGLEGKLVIPAVLFRQTPTSSSSLASCPSRPPHMKRSVSEASISHRGIRSPSALGSVREEGAEKEEGTWHRAAEETSEDGTGTSVTSVTSASVAPIRRTRRNRKDKTAEQEEEKPLTPQERRRRNMEVCNWSYDNVDGPVYDAVPALPIKQKRYEEVFIPDPTLPTASSLPTTLSSPMKSDDDKMTGKDEISSYYIARNPIYAHDVELTRREISEVTRRRGSHEGRQGWWVEKEWEVTAIPERKRLFLFGGSKRERRL